MFSSKLVTHWWFLDLEIWSCMEMKTRRFAGLLISLTGLTFCGLVWADSWQHTGAAQISTEFDSNPAMSPAYRGGISRILFEPSYMFAKEVGASELKAVLALQVARSSNKAVSMDREDPSVSADWRHHSGAGEFGLAAKYDQVATRTSETDATGRVSADSTRVSRIVSASWSKALSARSALSVNSAYSKVSYKHGTYVDYATLSTGMNFSYEWNESIVPFIAVSGIDQKPAVGPSSSRINVLLGMNWKILEHLDYNIQASKSKSSGVSSNNSSQWGMGLRYAGQRTSLSLSADRQVSPSGLGGFVTADQLNGSWGYNLNERSSIGLSAGWRKNRSITDDVNRTTDVWLQRELTALWSLRAHYLHRSRVGGGVGEEISNVLGLAFVYTHSNF